jgi:hypothetical protein
VNWSAPSRLELARLPVAMLEMASISDLQLARIFRRRCKIG